MKNNGRIRVFTWFENNKVEEPHWYINLMVGACPYTKVKEKVMLFEIATLAGSALYSVDSNIISMNFYRYKAIDKLTFLCKLQRYAQDKGYTVEFDPLQF